MFIEERLWQTQTDTIFHFVHLLCSYHLNLVLLSTSVLVSLDATILQSRSVSSIKSLSHHDHCISASLDSQHTSSAGPQTFAPRFGLEHMSFPSLKAKVTLQLYFSTSEKMSNDTLHFLLKNQSLASESIIFVWDRHRETFVSIFAHEPIHLDQLLNFFCTVTNTLFASWRSNVFSKPYRA